MAIDVTLQTFVAESREMLASMEHALLSIEHSSDRTEAVNAVFRAAHTIKGSAGLFGLESVVAFTHVVESVLDEVRDGLITIDDALVVLLLSCCDHLTALMDALDQGSDLTSEDLNRVSASLLSQLRLYLHQTAGEALPVARPITAAEAPAHDTPRHWHLSLRFGPEVLRHGLDPLSFITYLTRLGAIVGISTVSDALPDAEAMDPEACYLGFEIGLLSAATRESIENVFEFVRDECTLHLVPPDSPLDAYATLLAQLPEDRCALVDTLVACGSIDDAERSALLALAPGQNLPSAEPVTLTATAATATLPGTDDAETNATDAGLAAPGGDFRSPDARSIRIDADKLDQLINLVGELTIADTTTHLLARHSADPALLESLTRVSGLVQEVRDSALQLRMVKIGATFARFHRVVHDMAKNLGKSLRLEVSGEDTELDKTLVEKLSAPLMHLVRNAIDHGIEANEQRQQAGKPELGTIRLNAYHDSGHIVIEVSDDGAGLQPDRILASARERGLIAADARLSEAEIHELIFMPGFSTADQVTKLSGRGVGMDVVKRNITQLRGRIELQSRPGQGTTVFLHLPLTLASINGFLVGVGESMFVIPIDVIEECVELRAETAHDYCDLRGQVLPFVRLRRFFGMDDAYAQRESVVVLRHAGQRFGLVVDRLHGEFQTVIKPLSRIFNPIKYISGSTILGRGEIALILDVAALLSTVDKTPSNTPSASELSALPQTRP